MDSDGGSQVALDTRTSPPFLAHQFFPGPRVRDTVISGRQASFSSRLGLDSTCGSPQAVGSLERGACNHQYHGGRVDWDIKAWDWDSVLFLAQPNPQAAQTSDRQRTYPSEQNGSERQRIHLTGQNGSDRQRTYLSEQNGSDRQRTYLSEQNGSDPQPTYPNDQNGRRLHYKSPPDCGVVLRLDGSSTSPDHNGSSDQEDPYSSDRRRKHHLGYQENGYAISDKVQPFLRDGSSPEEDAESLSLKLGGHSYAYSDDAGNGSRSTKRYRSSSPPQFPMCQVDDCKADLSHAKDYHRRHKVCETHAKAGKALVTRLMQRFCQQCSRFHPLTEFDEGKRSCRRRLAGHNKRRRKNQPDPAAARGYSNGEENGPTKVAGLVGILNVLSQLQAVSSVGALNGVANDGAEALMQYLKRSVSPTGLDAGSLVNLFKVNSVSTENGRSNLKPESSSSGTSHTASGESTEALLTALAAAAFSSAGTETLSLLVKNQIVAALLKAAEIPLANGNGSIPVAPVGARMPEKEVQHIPCTPLSLSSPMAARPLETYLASSSRSRSNDFLQPVILENAVHRGEQQRDLQQGKVSPAAAVQKLFPITLTSELRGNGKLDVNREDDGTTESTSDVEAQASMMTYIEGQESRHLQEVASHSLPCIDLQLPPPQNLRESSPSGSDQSPSSSSYADWQDRTGRISFKLFDKNPGELPQSLRKQILEWLAHRPSDMESHIRPGCVVLTIYLSMPKVAWEELAVNLRVSLHKLTSCGEFWCKGRIHVQVEQQNALIVDGKVHLNKPKSKGLNSPRILSVRPLAVVAGQRTDIVIRGSNLQGSGTRLFCAYQGKYMGEGAQCVDQQLGRGFFSLSPLEFGEVGGGEVERRLSFSGGLPGVVGRCFIEVERLAGGGNAVPVIIADEPVCMEIRSLEQEIEKQGLIAADEAKRHGFQPEEVSHQIRVARAFAELEAENVLNELGWLFQKRQPTSPVMDPPTLLHSRHKRLLVYAVERDWCALARKILDIVFAFGLVGRSDQTLKELVDVFKDDTSLLHRAVKRKCRPMVELLLAYVPYSGSDASDATVKELLGIISKHGLQYGSIFTPDMPGPGGFTPLHIAASMEDAEEIIDALTSDPNQIGLHTWSHVQNSMGETPFACALAGEKASYMQLVRSKLARRDGQHTITMPINMPISTNSIFGHSSAKNTNNPAYALELPMWSKSSLPQLEMPAASRLVNPSRCRDVSGAMRGHRGSLYRPFMLSMVAVAAVCVCVCVVMRGPVQIRFILSPFSWNSVKFGSQ